MYFKRTKQHTEVFYFIPLIVPQKRCNIPGSLMIWPLLAALMTGCSAARTYYHESFEPVMSPKDYKFQASLSYKPAFIIKGSVTASLGKHLLLRGGYTGRFHVDGFDGALLAYFGANKFSVFGGPVYEYQHNIRFKPGSFFPLLSTTAMNYNCEYISPGLVTGLVYTDKGHLMQIILKANKNLVQQYRFSYFSVEGDGGKGSDVIFDKEDLNIRIPDFYTGEADLCYMSQTKVRQLYFKTQASLLFGQKSYTHNYTFQQTSGATELTIRKRTHPIYGVITINLGLVLVLGRKTQLQPAVK